MAQPHRLHLVGHPQRLQRVVPGRLAGLHVAEAAAAGADVAEDHEGRRAALPALADVGAVGLLADGVQVVAADLLLQPAVVRPARRRHLQPRRLAGAAEGDGAVGRGRGPARLGAGAGDVDALGGRRSRPRGGASAARSAMGSLIADPERSGRGSRPSSAGVGRAGSRSKTSPKRSATVAAKASSVLLGAELAAQRGHRHALDPAGHDPLERLQVVVDVDRQPVRGDAAADVDPDRADLAPPRPGRGPRHGRSARGPSVQTPVRPSIVCASTPCSASAAIITRSSRRTYSWTSSP